VNKKELLFVKQMGIVNVTPTSSKLAGLKPHVGFTDLHKRVSLQLLRAWKCTDRYEIL